MLLRKSFTITDKTGSVQINSLDYGVHILDVREEDLGSRSYDKEPIRGRSGDLLIDEGRYDNVSLNITVAIDKDAERNIYALNADLLALTGYQRIEHSYDLDSYMMGYYAGKIKPKISRRGDLSVAELTFDCKPQKFLKSGEQAQRIEAGESSSSMIVAEGRMKDIMGSGFHFYIVPEEFVTVLHVGDDWRDINLYYPSYMYGRTIQCGSVDGDPTGSAAVHGSGGDGIVDSAVMDRGSLMLTDSPYLYFTTPTKWEVLDANGNVIDSTFSRMTSIDHATKFPSSPLIRIHTKSDVEVGGRAVMLVNDGVIRLDNPTDVREGSQRYPVEDIYIDCDTMNAYMYLDDDHQVTYSMNAYVALPTRSIELTGGFNEIWTNNLIDYAEITPRWWTR